MVMVLNIEKGNIDYTAVFIFTLDEGTFAIVQSFYKM